MSQQRNRRSNRSPLQQGYIPPRENVARPPGTNRNYARVSRRPFVDQRKLLCIVAPLALALIVTIILIILPGSSSGQITLAQYSKFYEGMSYDEVVSIVGSPGTVESESTMFGSTMVTREWKGNGGKDSMCIIMFTDGKIHLMTQAGLR